jgi:hypothetical protein
MSTVIVQTKPRLAEPLWFLHNLSRILIDGEQSEGRFSLVELAGAGGDMPPLHIHPRWLVAMTGTSFARLVRDASVPAETATLPVDPEFDPQEIDAISTRHGIELLGPPGTLP